MQVVLVADVRARTSGAQAALLYHIVVDLVGRLSAFSKLFLFFPFD